MSRYTYHDLIRDLRSGPYAWPGGYPTFFVTSDSEVLCHKCVKEATCDDSDKQWAIIGCDVHWEGPPEYCAHCNCEIESAYGDPDAPEAID